MNNFNPFRVNLARREFIAAATAIAPIIGVPYSFLPQAKALSKFSLKAAPKRVRMVPEPGNETDVWGYHASVSGPEIRVTQGDRLRIAFKNDLAQGHVIEPMLTLRLNYHYDIEMTNATAWHHPIHLHGRTFRAPSRNGKPTQYREWQDTVLIVPRERVEIALVADDPGDWMFHCHIFEPMAGAMMGVIRVS